MKLRLVATLAAAVSIVLLLPCGAAMAQQWNPYYDKLPEAAGSEVQTWYLLYLSRIDNAQPHPGAANFQFSDPRLNSPFFSPISAAVRTAALATTGNTTETCLIEADLAANSQTGSKLGKNVRSYMLETKISTDDGVSNQAHAWSIAEAVIAGDAVLATTDGEVLSSEGLPVTNAQTGGSGGGSLSSNQNDLAWIMPLVNQAPQIAANQSQAAAPKQLLNGPESYVIGFQRSVDWFLDGIGNKSQFDVTTYAIEVWFGTYGTLPVLVAFSSTSYVLVDATNGVVAGPFRPNATMDPSSLLAGHPDVYMAGTAYSIVSATTTCAMRPPPGWWPIEPPSWTPAPAAPGTPPTTSPGRPTHWTDYRCSHTTNGGCRCESSGEGTTGAPAVPIKTRVVCTCSSDANGDCDPAPRSHPDIPRTPAGPIVPPGGGMTCRCDQEWLY